MKTALIAGSTGLIGSDLLKLLVENTEYEKIHVLVRREIQVESPKIITHIINFDELDVFDAGISPDHVFCTLGTTIKKAKTRENFRKVDYDYVLALGKMVKKKNTAKFLMVSSLGANAKSMIFYNRVKGEIEKALTELNLEHLFIFRPSLLMGNRQEHRSGEKTITSVYKVINPIFAGKLKKYKGIQSIQVARALIETALHNNNPFKIFESDEIQDI